MDFNSNFSLNNYMEELYYKTISQFITCSIFAEFEKVSFIKVKKEKISKEEKI